MDEKTRSEHSFESRRYLAKNGIYSTPAPFGYRNSGNFTLDIVPEEAAVVKQMFDWKTEDHYSYKLIASKLNAKGIKTKNNHRWVASSVEYVLHNPTYMGKIRYDNENVCVSCKQVVVLPDKPVNILRRKKIDVYQYVYPNCGRIFCRFASKKNYEGEAQE